MDCIDSADKPKSFYEMSPHAPPPERIKRLDDEKTVTEAVNLTKTKSDLPPTNEPKPEPGPTVADELNLQLTLVQLRPDRAKRIKRLVKYTVPQPQHMYKYFCICPRYHPCYVPCQHTGQIIIDRDMLKREEHTCFLATPKKNFLSPLRLRQPRYVAKKVYVPICTFRMQKLSVPHPQRVLDTYNNFKHILHEYQLENLQILMRPKPPVETFPLETAMEYMEEEIRQQRIQRKQQKKRCKGLQKAILERQRKQMMKIVCVLFEEMKEFLLNDQFIIDEQSPLCAVILDRIKEFTEQEFYTTSNLRDYQRILANNLTVWINKFISNLNIYLAPQQAPPPKAICAERGEDFLPVSDYISVSGDVECDIGEDFPYLHGEYEDFKYDDGVIQPSEDTIKN